MDPHDFGLLDSRCGCGSGIGYLKICADDEKLKLLNILLVSLKGTVKQEFSSVF
jgi:hypothetical protein